MYILFVPSVIAGIAVSEYLNCERKIGGGRGEKNYSISVPSCRSKHQSEKESLLTDSVPLANFKFRQNPALVSGETNSFRKR